MAIGNGEIVWSQSITGAKKFKLPIVITSIRPPFESDVSAHDGKIGYYLGTKNRKRKEQYHGDKRTGVIKFNDLRNDKVKFIDTKNKIVIGQSDWDWTYNYILLIDTDTNYNKIKSGILSVAKKNGIKIIGKRKLKTIKEKTVKRVRKSPAKKKKATKKKTTRRKR